MTFCVIIFSDTISQPLLSEENIREIREARNKALVPKTLFDLAIEAVAKNCTRLIDIPACPLKYLRKEIEKPGIIIEITKIFICFPQPIH
jgi:hypothetical protein